MMNTIKNSAAICRGLDILQFKKIRLWAFVDLQDNQKKGMYKLHTGHLKNMKS